MPELPEVETVVRSLRSALTGAEVRGVRCHYPPIVAGEVSELRRALRHGRFCGFDRHGKYIFFLVSGGIAVALHLRMTGQLFLADQARPPDPHTHLEILLAHSGRKLVYRDVRKFGRFRLVREGLEAFILDRRLGPDALAATPEQLASAFARTSRCLKAALLDQSVLAGLGNIYTDEVLFRAGLAPLRRADSLSQRECRRVCSEVREVLHAAIADRGTTISDYVDLEGELGGFQFSLQVYGRAGEPCRRCGTEIRKGMLAGRGTWYCPNCQA